MTTPPTTPADERMATLEGRVRGFSGAGRWLALPFAAFGFVATVAISGDGLDGLTRMWTNIAGAGLAALLADGARRAVIGRWLRELHALRAERRLPRAELIVRRP